MSGEHEHKFIVRADYYGIISSNKKTSFWFPKARGVLYFDENKMHFKGKNEHEDCIALNFDKIIKVKLESLNPRHNKWSSSMVSTPFYLLFWIPFWNRYILNITFLDEVGQPQELFLKLKTKSFSIETYLLLKKSLSFSKK